MSLISQEQQNSCLGMWTDEIEFLEVRNFFHNWKGSQLQPFNYVYGPLITIMPTQQIQMFQSERRKCTDKK